MSEQRVKFEPGKQKEFIKKVLERTNSPSLRELLSRDAELSYSCLKKYYQEKCLIPESLFEELCQLGEIDKNSLGVHYLPSNWGAVKGGKKGIMVMFSRYGDILHKWRVKAGKKSSGNSKEISYPLLDEKLAEFIGAYLGDGTLTRYFIRISGDRRYDPSYFNYLAGLVYDLFKVRPKIVMDKRVINTFYLIISSRRLCSFLSKEYGLKYGDKIRNKTVIPSQITSNEKLAIACLRGLIDTDGSVSRRGNQFCVMFRSHNPPLLRQVSILGRRLRVFTYLSKTETGTNSRDNVLKYFELIGSSNLKHIVRFNSYNLEGRALYIREAAGLYEKPLYRNMKFPFKSGPVV